MLYSILFLVGFLMRTLSDRFLIKSMKSNRSFKVRIQVGIKYRTFEAFYEQCAKIL